VIASKTDPWWTEYRWAGYGSRLQTQLYVNRKPDVLNAKVLEALPALAARRPELEWVVPRERSHEASASGSRTPLCRSSG
jgi:hypothetical protein